MPLSCGLSHLLTNIKPSRERAYLRARSKLHVNFAERTQARPSSKEEAFSWTNKCLRYEVEVNQSFNEQMTRAAPGRQRPDWEQKRKGVHRAPLLERCGPYRPMIKSPSPTSPPPRGSCPPPPSQSSGAGMRDRGSSQRTARPARRPRPGRSHAWPVRCHP